MSRQLHRYEDFESIKLCANSMHVVKNILLTPHSPEHCVFRLNKCNSWEVISDQSSPLAPTNTPHSNLNGPPGFSSNDEFVCQRGTQKYQQFLKTGLVSQKIKRCWRSKPHAKAPFTKTVPPPSSPTTLTETKNAIPSRGSGGLRGV